MKIKKILFALALLLGLTSCGVNGTGSGVSSGEGPSSEIINSGENSNSSECENGVCGGDLELNLDAINEYLATDSYWADLKVKGDEVALIPFTHINGPRNEWNFFAIVHFQKKVGSYYRYQVTYLSCTCRSSQINYWQTMYVELTRPSTLDEVKLKKLTFDYDGTGDYLAGFWGDSGVTHPIDNSDYNVYYEDIKTGFIPFLVGKTYAELSSYDGAEIDGQVFDDTVFGIDPTEFEEDMAGVMFRGEQVRLDHFGGASVSTNNMLRVIIALMEYHGANNL